MKHPTKADELLIEFRVAQIEKKGDEAFLCFEECAEINKAHKRGDETYPMNLKEYFANLNAAKDEMNFLKDELNKALT